MSLALGKVSECPFAVEDVGSLKEAVVDALAAQGLDLNREGDDPEDVLVDLRFLDLQLRAASDPEAALGSFAGGVRAGPGVRLPRLPALYRPKRKWRLADQADPCDYQEEELLGTCWTTEVDEGRS